MWPWNRMQGADPYQPPDVNPAQFITCRAVGGEVPG